MSNMTLLLLLIPLLPLAGFLLLGPGRKLFSRSVSAIIGCMTIAASFIISIMVFMKVLNGSVVRAHFFDFISISALKIGFDFTVDPLSGLFLLIITGVGLLIHIYSSSYMKEESSADFSKYFSFLNLFVFSMLLLVLGSNFVIMFIGWEGVGLCSYLLIGYWFKNSDYTKAAQKAFVMNRIGDLGFLLAVFWMIARLGTVSYDEIFSAASLAKLSNTDITAITLLLFVGATGKSAQIPLFTWLPDAMAGPTPVSALIHAATMVTAGIYMIARSGVLYAMAPFTLDVIAVVGLATALLAASVAIRQNDIKKVLAYSTVSQLGFMFLALGSGAYTAAVFHVMTHAFFKALLFLGAGSVIHAMGGDQDLRNMGGLKKKMPITHFTFLVGCLAIAGIPPLSGFFSKDEILASAFGKHFIFWLLALFAALMTAFYMFRLYAMTFLGDFRGTEHQKHHLHESPSAMTVPLILLAVLSVAGGLIGIPEFILHGGHRLAAFLEPVFSRSNELLPKHVISHSTEYLLMGASVALVVVVVLFSLRKFSKYASKDEAASGLGKLLENKWYVDELYDSVVARPLGWCSSWLNTVLEAKVIDGFVNGVGKGVNFASRQLRWLQSGQVGTYMIIMTIGLLIMFILKYYF